MLDGGITNNTPVFEDNFDRRQLVFRLFSVAYPSSMSLSTVDPCVDALVMRGAMQMRDFLGGEKVILISFILNYLFIFDSIILKFTYRWTNRLFGINIVQL